MKSIYLDWAATAPVHPEIPQLYANALTSFQGNPSSAHNLGRKAREEIEQSRKNCSILLNTKPDQLIFTSGGTESNGIVLSSMFKKKPGAHVILSAIEHPSIYEFATSLKFSGFEIDFIKPNSRGTISSEDLLPLLKPNTSLVAIMAVNNETAAIQPLNDIISLVRDFENRNGRSIHIHTDAVQALGKISFTPELYNIDSASFSAHKIGGPKGIGMLYVRKPISVLSPGGGQEFSIRPGTENTAGIIAFSRAMQISLGELEKNFKHAENLKKLLTLEISKIEGTRTLFDSDESFSPYITSITAAPIPGEVLVRILSDEGFQISTGSACSSHKREKQMRVLKSSGINEKDAAGSIRVSTGWSSTESDILDFCTVLKGKIFELRKYHK